MSFSQHTVDVGQPCQ